MVTYCALEPPGGAPRNREGAEELVFVKDGFIPLAVVIPVIWMLWNRMWVPVLGYLIVMTVLQTILLVISAPPFATAIIGILVNILIGLEAGALRRWSLVRKGWTMVDAVDGYDLVDCERRVFARWMEPVPVKGPAVDPFGSSTTDQDDVVGFFPDVRPTR